ncbi:MAG: type II secretion system F family protein [Candidatus Zhuqueibacterota bacterium]
MEAFQYKGIDRNGRNVKGIEFADNRFILTRVLEQKGIRIIWAEKARPDQLKASKEKSESNKRVKNDDIIIFFRELSTMIDAGIQLVDALDILEDQIENQSFKGIIRTIKTDIQGGMTFSDGLGRHPRTFPRLAVAMSKAAESGGGLAPLLAQLSDYLEEEDQIKKQIKSAMAYPKFAFLFFGAVVLSVIFGLMPKFKAIFASLGNELPRPTQILLDASDAIKRNGFYELAVIALLVALYKYAVKTPNGRFFIDRLKLGIPVVGKLMLKSLISRFCKTLKTLTMSRVAIIEALQIAGETADNIVVQEAIQRVRKGVMEGARISDMLNEQQLFPRIVIKMVAVGEESGALDKMLGKVSEFYDRQFSSTISSLTSIIEPAMMIGLGILALVVVIALYLPIFQMSGAVR